MRYLAVALIFASACAVLGLMLWQNGGLLWVGLVCLPLFGAAEIVIERILR